VPFATPYKRASHFLSHGHEFGAQDEYDYERMADEFMGRLLHPDLYECIRTTGAGDRVRLEGATGWYGVAFVLTVRTFHTKTQNQIAVSGGPAGFVTRKCMETK
jgi:hypothetical protein